MPKIVPMRLALLLAPVLALVLVQPLAQSSAEAATIPVPKTRTFQAGIDPYGSYVGQSTCNGTAKPGVVYVKDMLNATYGPRTIGIVRSCSAGGTSEHKEGRALDWMISARVSSQKAQADAFVRWLLATDKFGNSHAMVRRMGVMYIIWNNKMWRAYDPGRGWTEYKGCSSTPSSGYDTTCHRDHVHISFTWNGAYARTSLYTGRVPFQVSAGVSNSSPAVGDTVNVTGSVSPVVGAVGKKVSINRLVGTTSTYQGSAIVDATGRYSFPVVVTKPDVYRFKAYKPSEGCTTSGCAYGAGSSAEVGFTVNNTVKARYALTLTATPDVVPTGTPVVFTGTVTPANAAEGKRVSLKIWNETTKAYDTVDSGFVQADGTYAITATPPAGSSRYVVYKPNEECTASGCAYVGGVSAAVTVQALGTVPYSVDAKVTLASAPVGGTVKIVGSVDPSYASPGTRVSLRKVVGDTLEYVGSYAVGPRGDYVVPVVANALGTQRYRVYKPSDGCADGRCEFAGALSEQVAFSVVPVRPFTATATVATTSLVGQPTKVQATFAPASVAAGNRVTFQQKVNGVWKRVATRNLDARGSIALTRTGTAAGKQYYRYVVGPDVCASGVCAYTAVSSPTTTLTVVKSRQQRLDVQARLSSTKVKVGGSVTVTGRVSPAKVVAGTSVSLRRQKDGVLAYVGGARVAPDGTFSIKLPATAAGTQVYRVYHRPMGCGAYGCLYDADVSVRLTLTVIR